MADHVRFNPFLRLWHPDYIVVISTIPPYTQPEIDMKLSMRTEGKWKIKLISQLIKSVSNPLPLASHLFMFKIRHNTNLKIYILSPGIRYRAILRINKDIRIRSN